MVAMETIATLKRISADELSGMLQSERASDVAVVDVRDDDHVGGHIRSSIHVPSSSLDHRLPGLVRNLAGKDAVVFHCALSQQRGPSAALRYMRERDSKIKKGEIGMPAEANDMNAEDGSIHATSTSRKEQEVYVLDKGFVGWQGKWVIAESYASFYEN